MSSPTTYTYLKDAATLLVAGVSVWLALRQWKESTEEQRLQHQWKKAEKGRELIDDLFKSNDKDEEFYAWDAMRMLDYVDSTPLYVTKPFRAAGPIPIDTAIIHLALKPEEFNETQDRLLYVRECFDELYFKMAQFQDAIDNQLVELRHVEYPIDYYIGLMAEDPKDAALHYAYLKKFGYGKTLRFLKNFAAWNSAMTAAKITS